MVLPECKGLIVALFLPLPLLTPCIANEEESEERIVNAAVTSINRCYHWCGETGDQSDERNAQILEGIERDCPEAERLATEAHRAYPDNPVLSANLLKLIDSGYFEATDQEQNVICDAAMPYFKKSLLGSGKKDVLYHHVCPTQAAKLSSVSSGQ